MYLYIKSCCKKAWKDCTNYLILNQIVLHSILFKVGKATGLIFKKTIKDTFQYINIYYNKILHDYKIIDAIIFNNDILERLVLKTWLQSKNSMIIPTLLTKFKKRVLHYNKQSMKITEVKKNLKIKIMKDI